MQIETITKPAFTVIGKEGSTADGTGFIAALWDDANAHFGEVAALALTADGVPVGIWGAMTDFSKKFLPWQENFTQGLYLAGVEVPSDAVAPQGWTKWEIPGFVYLRVRNDAPDVFAKMLDYIAENGMALAGAVHDFTDAATGTGYMLFPIEKL